MNFSRIETTSLILFGLAVLILVALVFVSSNNLISATLILIAFACFIAGLFLFTFQKKAQVDAGIAGLFAAPYIATTSRLLADLGVSGAATFIPIAIDGNFPSPVMQFNPVSEYRPVKITEDTSFVTSADGAGVLTVPSGFPLYAHLAAEKSLTIPGTEPDLFAAIKEAGEDLLEISDAVTVARSGEEISLSLAHFLLISGCRAAMEASPRTCLMAPCPVCSLFAMMLAMCSGEPVTLNQISVEKDTLVIRMREELGEGIAVRE